MTDSFEFTLDNPLTEEQWDMINDVDFDRTDRIWFHTKHGNEVEFTKVRHGKWITKSTGGEYFDCCSECGHVEWDAPSKYCPNCGARMDEDERD